MTKNIEQIKLLRGKTGASLMDCKIALQDENNNFEKALINLQKKGFASAEKKKSRLTTEGVVTSYIHSGSKLGVLLELNCETDFVARRIEFKTLAHKLAIQVASCNTIKYISFSDIPTEELNLIKETIASSDPKLIAKKAISRENFSFITLLDQQYFENPALTVEDYIKTQISLLGENITVKRFCKYRLGEN